MKIQRTIPPAAAVLGAADLMRGLAGLLRPGPCQRQLKREFRIFFRTRHIFGVSSGKAALTVILRALKTLSPERTEVLIPAYTCFSVPSAVVKAGLDVSLCDIDRSTFDFDTTELRGAVTEKTLCVVPDHLFGMPSDMETIVRTARRQGAFVVEDAAQAMGGAVSGRKLGTLGDVGFFSLGRGKNVTGGSGGIILTNSDAVAAAIEREYSLLERPGRAEQALQLLNAVLLALFVRPALYWLPAQLPFLKLGETVFYRDFPVKRLSGVQAGLLRRWQSGLDRANRARRGNAAWFRSRLGMTAGSGLPRAYLRLPVLADGPETRNKICALSREQGLGISSMYPTPVSEIAELRDRFKGKKYRTAMGVSQTLFTLPTHELLSRKDREKIVQFIRMRTAEGQVSHGARKSEVLAKKSNMTAE